MKKFALIGNPISHSKSPQLFKETFPDRNMSYDLLERDTIEESVAELKRLGYSGANVTAPFKESVMQFVTDPDPISKAIGASNLILFDKDRIFSYNTDYLAVRRMIQELETDLHDKAAFQDRTFNKAIVIGCGGAGKAATLACLYEGLDTVIANRTLGKAENFAMAIGDNNPAYSGRIKALSLSDAESLLKILTLENQDIKKELLVIYTIPQADGIVFKTLANSVSAGKNTVIEANYKDPVLNLESGKTWLRYQAVESFRILTGITPDENRMQL